jgi:hypothetical protein
MNHFFGCSGKVCRIAKKQGNEFFLKEDDKDGQTFLSELKKM